MKNSTAVTASIFAVCVLLVLCVVPGYTQVAESPLLTPLIDSGSESQLLGSYFPFAEIDTGGVCSAVGNACGALVDSFSFSQANPAGSSLIYGAPGVGFSHTNWFQSITLQTLAFVHTIDNFGFGFSFNNANVVTSGSSRNLDVIFNTSHIAMLANFSANLVRSYEIDGLSIGLNAKYYRTTSLDAQDSSGAFPSYHGMYFDLGLLFSMHALKVQQFDIPNLSIGIYHKDFGLVLEPGAVDYGNLNAALAYRPIEPLWFAFNALLDINRALSEYQQSLLVYSVGIGVAPFDFLELNAGAEFSDNNIDITASIALQLLGASVRFTQHYTPITSFAGLDTFTIDVQLLTQSTISENRLLSIQKLYLQALQAFTERNYDGALAIISSILNIYPGYVPAITLREQIEKLAEVDRVLSEDGVQ